MATVNRHGADWLAIRAWANDKIQEQIEALVASDEAGDVRRGQIGVLREMIEMVEPAALPEVDDVNYER